VDLLGAGDGGQLVVEGEQRDRAVGPDRGGHIDLAVIVDEQSGVERRTVKLMHRPRTTHVDG